MRKLLIFLACLLVWTGVPFFAIGAQAPWYSRQATWEESMRVSREALMRQEEAAANSSRFKPAITGVLRGGQPAQHLVVDVTDLETLWLMATTGGDNYDYDQAIWGEPKLIAKDGSEVLVSTIKPVSIKVGFGQLVIDKNNANQPLRIGGQEFKHGFWAHAPSELRFALNGKYARFEAWVGISSAADNHGTVEFKALDRSDSPGISQDAWQQIALDFSSADAQQQMNWEREDNLWQQNWTPGDFAELARRYAQASGRVPALAEQARKVAPGVKDAAGLAEVRALYRRSRVMDSALSRIPGFPIEALRLGIDDLVKEFGPSYPRGAAYLKRLAELEQKLSPLINATNSTPSARQSLPMAEMEQFTQAITELESLKREALLGNPLLDFDRLLLLKREFPDPKAARQAMGDTLGVGDLNAHTSDTIPRSKHWQDELVTLSNLRGAPQFKTVFRAMNMETIIDPTLHFDGRRLLFAKMGLYERNWRLFEIYLDGAGFHQVTPDDGADVGHFDPCYLADGQIIFASTAVYQGLPCEFGGREMVCLYRLDPKTENIRQLTFEQDSDWCPTMLHNGRVLYQRWEYTDQSHANSRMLFHMNPDGTDQREYRGSGSWFPASFFYAKPIPGNAHQVIGVAGGHHGTPRSGRLLIFDPSQGRHDAEGIVQEIPGHGKKVDPIVRDRLVDGVWPQFLMPCPLSTKYHIVAAKLRPESLWGIYLVDVFDNMTLIKEVEGAALLWPIAVRAGDSPPVIPDRVDLTKNEATVFITDLNSGPGLKGVPRGTVKSLRIIEYYFSKRGMGGLYGTLGLDGPWDVKRILGTVPVEPDGSVYFTIPANSPISLQPLDGQGQALQLMRSWLIGMPGEAVSCSGCHEPQNDVSVNSPTLASRRKPSAITPWHGPARGFSFVREVQPVLDKYCVSCHDGSKTNLPSFKGGVMMTNWTSQLAGRWDGGGRFTQSYFELQRYVRRPGIEGDRRMFTPMEFYFATTELGQRLRMGHHGVELDTEAFERLTTWVDFNAPFFGTWGEIPQFNKGAGGANCAQLETVSKRADELRRQYVPMGPFTDYEAVPEIPKYDTTPVIPKATARVEEKPIVCEGWPFDATSASAKQKAATLDLPRPLRIGVQGEGSDSLAPQRGEGRGEGSASSTKIIDLGNGVQLELVRIPGGQFIMGSSDGELNETPRAVVEVRPFWMARFETANRQFKQFMAEHDSRTEDRHGYQFGALAYDQNQPDQPAVRVSWSEANAFCQWVSQKACHKVKLPTEAQWEWSCRAGSAAPFWYGDLNADYSPFANLADRKLKEFAADTSLDNYTAARPMTNPNRYDDWIPRDDRFDDGGFVTEPVTQYKPNPWGLHNMHGNAWEWTRSAYRSYPYRDDDGRNETNDTVGVQRVVRGGSWYDRPSRCTSSFRLSYCDYQKVYNVGFRVVCED